MRRRDLQLLPLLSRREALAGLAAAAAVAGCAPEDDGYLEYEDPPETIEHVIIVMMENRSFDHYLGALKLLEGWEDLDGVDASMSNSDAEGNAYPVGPAAVACVTDPPHSWGSSHNQYNEGANDGFVRAYASAPEPGEVMAYQTRENLPILWALADSSVVCDAWFCSVMGPTWPNRLYAHAGTSDGERSNDLPEGGLFTFPSVWTKLEEAGVDWRYYYSDIPFLPLFEGAWQPGHHGYLDQFVEDCFKGDLPAVTWIDPAFGYNDDHPPHHPGLGQEFLAIIYEALATSAAWRNCLLIITYDEHGGFFDHVPPPQTDDDHAADGFDQLGFRVPTLVIGPYVKAGVSHTPFDHTSWLKYVCERFGIEPWTARIAAANSLAELLDSDRMRAGEPADPIELPAFDIDDDAVADDCFYGASAARRRHSGQPELAAHIAATAPDLDVSDRLDAMMARLRAWRSALR